MPERSLHPIRTGTKIARFKPGPGRPSAWFADDMNWLVDAINALLNPRIVRGEKDLIQFSDTNWTLTLKDSGDGPGVALQMFKIAEPTAERPTIDESDYIICRTWDGTTLGTLDVYVAKSPLLRRSLTSATVLGAAVTYTYGVDALDVALYPQSKLRTKTIGTDTEQQRIVPPWSPGEIIFAAEAENTGVSVSGVPVTLIEYSRRYWMAIG